MCRNMKYSNFLFHELEISTRMFRVQLLIHPRNAKHTNELVAAPEFIIKAVTESTTGNGRHWAPINIQTALTELCLSLIHI